MVGLQCYVLLYISDTVTHIYILFQILLHYSLLLFSHYDKSDSVTPWTAAHQVSLSSTISQSLHKLMAIVSDAIQPSHPLWSPLLLLPSTFPSIRVFSSESALCIRGPNYGSFNFSISPSSEHSRFISFRIDWFDLLAVQRTFKSLLQHHNYTVYYKILNIVPCAIPWRKIWQPTPIFLPKKPHRQGSLAGYSPWTCKELDTTEYICTSVLYSMILMFIYFMYSNV